MNDALVMLAISTVIGVIQAIFWRWVAAISDYQATLNKKIENVNQDLMNFKAEIYQSYQSKKDAHTDSDRIMASLQKIEQDVAKISDKLDKKADKI